MLLEEGTEVGIRKVYVRHYDLQQNQMKPRWLWPDEPSRRYLGKESSRRAEIPTEVSSSRFYRYLERLTWYQV